MNFNAVSITFLYLALIVNDSYEHTPIRFVGGKTKYEGRVEIFHSGRWGTLCGRGFDESDARVVCRMLGKDLLHPVIFPGSHFGSGNGTIWLSDLDCVGHESDISLCANSGWGSNNCRNGEDMGLNCDTDARLVHGSSVSEGRLEILHDNIWGTVCNNNFDVRDAKVICRMLGYKDAQPEVFQTSKFGKGSSDIWMDNLSCNGDELDISNCTFNGWGNSSCTHSLDVGISCATQIRLVGGSVPFEGRVEVFHKGKWGTICDDLFDVNDAKVLCRTMGFSSSHPTIYKHSPFGSFSSSMPILMDDLQCLGTETDIASCYFSGWGNSDCTYQESVSIRCGLEIRVNAIKSEELLEVKLFGQWGAVCADGFGYTEANVACRMFGYKKLYPTPYKTPLSLAHVAMSNVKCTGKEYDLRHCHFDAGYERNCSHAVVLKCDYDTEENVFQLTRGYYGTIQVRHNGQWGSVCDDGFDMNDGQVACASAGYHTLIPTVHGSALWGSVSGTILMDDLACTGKESRLSFCKFNGWGNNNCQHTEDVGVNCDNAVRLVNGDGMNSGRVEMFYSGSWRTVCDEHFDISEAKVICKIMRMDTENPIIYKGAHFGEGSGSQYVLHGCSGTENTITGCSIESSYSRCGSHSKDVSVYCEGDKQLPVYNKVGIYNDYDLRLVNGSTESDGTVEVYKSGTWIPICDSNSDVTTAKVICKLLGYDEKNAVMYNKSYNYYNPSQQLSSLYHLHCSGSESGISSCSKNIGTHRCSTSSFVGVACKTQARLISKTNNKGTGRLEINYHGQWSTMCADNFDAKESQVICRMLGFDDRQAQIMYGSSEGTPLLREDLTCIGDEDDISICTFKGWTSKKCSDQRAVWLTCKIPMRLSDGNVVGEGRLELLRKGEWISVCNNNFTEKEAAVACKSLGYSFKSPDVFSTENFGVGTSQRTVGKISCSGSEEYFSECDFQFGQLLNCTSEEAVGISCSTNIRLENGRFKNEGRLEIQHNETWGTVCADNFDIMDARVICSMLGFNNPYPEICDKSCFGEGNTSPIITNMQCLGNELDISECYFKSSETPCNNTVGVFCRTQLRLVNGVNPSEGRLEVYHNNEWGTVCRQNFDDSDARVVCRMFGYDNDSPTIFSGNFYGNGTGTIWISELGCWGTEDDLGQCDFAPWGINNCNHEQDVSIDCGVNVRLVGGSAYNEGRVEIFHSKEWGTICGNTFSEEDGKVVCRMLGFDTENITIVTSSVYGLGRQDVQIENLNCTGMESHIAACKFRGWGHVQCSSGYAGGVICGGTKMRLVNSVRPSEGRLEILHNNAWGTVCSDNFDKTDAATVCNLLGYKTRYPHAIGQAFFGEGTGRVWLDEINCNGTEDDLFKCGSNGWGNTNCGHSKDVSILCDTMVRLVGGTKDANGRIEIFHNGLWGTICDTNFDRKAATVVCKMLGYNNSDAMLLPNSYYGQGHGKIFFSDLHCDGTEADLENCKYTSWDNSKCNHADDISVDCATPVRLLGGRGPFEGTVEVYHSGAWGEVCDTNFDVKDAEVICRMLGYVSKSPRVKQSTTSGTGLVWMDKLACSGDETDVALCKSDGFGPKACARNRKAAIYCGQDIQVNIDGGKGSFEGNIAILNGSTWYPVCKEGFTMDSAMVVCRTLGFSDSTDPKLLDGQGAYLLSNVSGPGKKIICSGSEGDVGLCQITTKEENCTNQAIRCPRIAVRLVNGTQSNEGRVEVLHDGKWGNICGRGFQQHDARVVCKMLGLQKEEQYFVNEEFGTSKGPVFLENMSCTGNENDISGCLLNWKPANCSGQKSVGLRCSPTTIRLVGGGGPWEGRVEVMHNGKWGSVCDTNFGNEEAAVVCRMLGFKDSTTESYARNASFFGSSSYPILLDQISCTGSELDINACRTKKWGFHTCDNDHEAGVLCRASNLRLSGGSHTMEGRVEVLFNGKWSTICDEEWDDNDATTICRMLTSYPLNKIVAGKAFRNSYFGGGSYTAALSNLKCNGSEVDLLHCSMNKGGRPHCDHSRDAGVSCSLNAASYLNGQNQSKGTFQTQISNYSGSICDRDVSESIGAVLCKALGYWSNTAVVYRNSWFGQGQGTSFDLKPKCTGKESNILFCNLGNTFGRQTCTHSQDIGVQCTTTPLGLFKIRLALGNSKGDGRLEIKYNDKWGTVCSTDWTPQNSEVVCRMLGFRHPIIQTKALPRNDTHVLLGSLSCIGPEHDIGFCKGTVDKSNCTNEVVSIDCTGGMEIKLSGGSSPADGRIDVKQNGQWGSLCDSSYTLSDLQVLCNMLGYRDTLPYQYHLPSVEIHKAPFGIDTLSCSGYEDHIMQCLFSKTASCHHRYAHLKCFDCVYEHTTTTGTIVSDHYPGRYSPDTDCLYIIKPPQGLYKVVVDVLQMADTGDFIQIKDSPLGKELGYYSVSSYIPAAVSNEFWIRFKTNGQKSARGFKLHWSPFEVKDLLSLNCEIDRWGAAINITLLRMTSMYVNYSDIYLTNPDCFGQVIGDKLMFDQLYGECGSTRNDSGLFITYQNNLTLIADNVTYEIPLECKIFKDDRVFHFHPGFDYMELDKPGKRSSDSLYEINLFFDSELTLQDVTDFNGKFVYIINRHDSNMQLSLNACNFTMHRKDTDDFFSIVENSKPVLETVRVKNVHPGSIQLEIQISENVPSVLECDFVSK